MKKQKPIMPTPVSPPKTGVRVEIDEVKTTVSKMIDLIGVLDKRVVANNSAIAENEKSCIRLNTGLKREENIATDLLLRFNHAETAANDNLELHRLLSGKVEKLTADHRASHGKALRFIAEATGTIEGLNRSHNAINELVEHNQCSVNEAIHEVRRKANEVNKNTVNVTFLLAVITVSNLVLTSYIYWSK